MLKGIKNWWLKSSLQGKELKHLEISHAHIFHGKKYLNKFQVKKPHGT